MAEKFIRHKFAGGWATDFGRSADAEPDRGGLVQIPFLVDAENVIYEFDGGPHKAPGTTKLNASAFESGAVVKGIFDAWFSGTSGASAQHRIVHVGTKIKKDDGNESFSDLFTGMEAGKVPSYAMLEDLLVIASDSTTDVPKSWDGTTAQSLAGSPPNFAFVVEHKNRLWAAGDASNPSRLYYSVLLDPADWASAGSGNIDVSPDDGDRITGLISHKNELWVFKGPYKGSIHRITGSAPTGSDAFARKTFVTGVGAAAHNLIFRFRDDIGFVWSDATVRSLKATNAYGDFAESSLSRPIDTWLREHVNFSRLGHGWAVDWPEYGMVLIALPVDSGSNPNRVLVLDYRFEPVRWALWSSFSAQAACLGLVIDPDNSDKRVVMGGGTDGYVRKFGQRNRSADGTSISFKVTTPHLTYANPFLLKVISGGSLAFVPHNANSVTFGWTRDGNAQQTYTVTQTGYDVLTPTASGNPFTLGSSRLAGGRFVDSFFDLVDGDEFRSIQYQVMNNTNNQDVEVHAISALITEGTRSLEN